MGLFDRRSKRGASGATRLYYASDIHGSELLWRKFLSAANAYEARFLIMGGDVTGKAVVPLVRDRDGYHLSLFGQASVVSEDELEAAETRIRNNGMYPFRTSREELAEVEALDEEAREKWFAEVMRRTFEGWLELAAERLDPSVRCFVMPGNDDPPEVSSSIEQAAGVEACDDRVVELGEYSMMSLGYANRTPFDSPRELDEDELLVRIDALAERAGPMERCIFNLHVPPHDSTLDIAPALDENLEVQMSGSAPRMIPVGSTAVRDAIERHQPILSLHGHVHESPGATRIGRTVAINPGSEYHTGRISGCIVNLRGDRVRHQFVAG